MSEATSRFSYVTYIATTPEDLWTALTRPDQVEKSWFGARFETDWKVGSPWRLVFADGRMADSGEVVEFTPERRLELTWQNQVEADLSAEGYSHCVLELTQQGAVVRLALEHWMDRANSRLIAGISNGWPQILSNTKSLLETGKAIIG